MPSAKAELPARHQIGGPIRCRGRLEEHHLSPASGGGRAHLAARRRESEFRLPRGVEALRADEEKARQLFGWGKRLVDNECFGELPSDTLRRRPGEPHR